MRFWRMTVMALFGLAACAAARLPALPARYAIYVGTYTGGEGKGVFLFHMDPQTGTLTPRGTSGIVSNPSFLALHPSGRFLYAVSETGGFGGRKTGSVAAFSLDPDTGGMKFLNQEASEGTGPCHLVVDRKGGHVLVANYGSGTAAVLPIRENGGLGPAVSVVRHEGKGPHPRRQEGPHAHSINLSPGGRFAFVADLGIDRVMVYRYDENRGILTPNEPPFVPLAPGSGPRHLAFRPDGRFVYVINELLSTVTVFAFDPSRGALKELQTVSTLPEGFQGQNTTAEVQVTPDGRLLYGSNRGHDSLAIFSIDAALGTLTPCGHQSTQGKTPRNFGIDPSGRWLLVANQGSDSIVVFRIDAGSGRLESVGAPLSVPKPVCVKFLPLPG